LSRPDDTFRPRLDRLAARLREEGLAAYVLEDFENQRTSLVRWLSGHPSDAILVVAATGESVLVPWDVNMASERARVDRVVPYTDFKRSYKEAVATVLASLGIRGNVGGTAVDGTAARDAQAARDGTAARPRVEFASRTSHLRREELRRELAGIEIVLRGDGIDAFLAKLRSRKDAAEIAALERAAAITDEVLDVVEREVRSRPAGALREVDVAQLVEREALARGAEGMGFETLAAGPARSWGIHAFPAYTAGAFGSTGLSILDFGVKVDGYTTDVTATFARGPLGADRERMLSLVQTAYDAATAAAMPGADPRAPAIAADQVFEAAGWKMPHALGHGIGLDSHEGPLLRSLGDNPDRELATGMVFTVEPGLYHPDLGGVRLENDVLIDGRAGAPVARVLTRSRIVRLE
jgi:Xaa-Pro dipeptidase